MVHLSFLPTTLIFIGFVRAANDWSKPCHDGSCSYDVTNGTVSGTMLIAGSPRAISDITPAGGWTILSCNASAGAQNIRAVCTGNASACGHLYQGGAVGTLVRLPDDCGIMPFARVANEWTDANQTLPANANLHRRDNSNSTASVRGLALDTDFAAIDPSQNGNVTLFIQGATGTAGNFTVTDPATATKRGLFTGIEYSLMHLNDIDINKNASTPFNIDQSFNLFNDSVACPQTGSIPAFTGEVNIAVEAKASGTVDYGVVVNGTLVPPKISQFGLFATLDGSLNGILTINASATATFDTGKKQIFEQGIPGLSFSGVLDIGPAFVVNVQGIATLDTEVNMAVDLAYTLNNATLFFPPGAGSSSGGFAPADTGLSLAASPNVAASGSLEAHVIPTLQLGIDALGGTVKANVNLDLDSSAKLALSLTAGATASTSTTNGSSTAGTFGGCVDVSTTLAVNAGADAGFPGIFDKSASVALFSKTFDLFNKCFGSGSSKRGALHRRHPRDTLARRALTCPGAGVSVPSAITSGTVAAADIKAQQ